jgi:lipopolysaccharide biosynthesis protein
VGHLHSKRSLLIDDAALGENWREFLWQNLLGDLYPMMDIILERFDENRSLGIVFPEDPHLSDWDDNLEIGSGLANRMGIGEPLPPFFDFPIGTMFWARPKALEPLFELKFGWEDFPEEPLPYDGTMLHALERLLPLVATHAGYRFATTQIPGVTR